MIVEEQRACFCAYGGDYCKVYVKKNRLTDVIVMSNGERVPKEFQGAFRTVDELFTFVHSINRDSAASSEVEYDSRFGYPKHVAVDYSSHVIDEEIAYNIRSIQHLRE